MTFVHPAAYILFILVLIPIILYLLPMPRRRVKLPSLILWGRMLKERPASQSWRWLRTLVSLLLQVAVLVLLVFAAGKPIFAPAEGAGDKMVVVLDVSGSMKAPLGMSTRFASAQKFARGLIDGMPSGKKAALLAAGTSPIVVSGMTDERQTVLKKLDGLACTDGGTNLKAAISLATELAEGEGKTDIYVISDGRAPVSDLKLSGASIHYYCVGETVPNVGVVEFQARRAFDYPEEYQAFARIQNSSPAERAVEMTFTADDNVIDKRMVKIGANQTVAESFSGKVRGDGLLKVSINSGDAFPADDSAWVLLGAAQKPKVLLVRTEPDRFLEAALAANLSVETFVMTPDEYKARPWLPDVIILQGTLPAELPPGNLLIINPPATNPLFEVTGDVQTPRPSDWRQEHPILADLTLQDVYIPTAKAVKTPPWATVLAESEGTPLMFAGKTGTQRVVVLTFDPAQSSIKFRVAFPVIVARAIQWLTEAGDIPNQVKAGEQVLFSPPDERGAIGFTCPDGKSGKLSSRKGTYVLPASQAGVYRVSLTGKTVTLVANLADANESDLSVAPSLQFADGKVDARKATGGGLGEFWLFAAAAALVLLAVEWYLYHHRFVV
jgi:hypothetical protein